MTFVTPCIMALKSSDFCKIQNDYNKFIFESNISRQTVATTILRYLSTYLPPLSGLRMESLNKRKHMLGKSQFNYEGSTDHTNPDQ